MKRFHFIAMVLMALICASCVSTSEIDDLQNQIDALKAGKIATVEQQIENIRASIVELEVLQKKLDNLGVTDNTLNSRIDALVEYVDTEIENIKDWSNTTFATLTQYQGLLDELERIKNSIPDVADAISKSEASMRSWVSEQLAGYYTIAQMNAKLKELSDADAKIIKDFTKAKEDLEEAYAKAISEAIAKYNGEITTKIAADIKTATDSLQLQIDALADRISKLESRACSLVIEPYYSDGSVRAVDGILSFKCMISPTSAMNFGRWDDFKIMVTTTTTKALPSNWIRPDQIIWTEIDDLYSELQISADITKFLPLEEGKTLGFHFGYFSENSSIVSDYTNITLSFTEDYDKTFMEDICGNVWDEGTRFKYVFNPLMGMVWIMNQFSYQVCASDVWFIDDIQPQFKGEDGHYLMKIDGPYGIPYEASEMRTLSLHLESNGTLRIQHWDEDESGNYTLTSESFATRYCRKKDYNATEVESDFFELEAPELNEYIFLGSYCPKATVYNTVSDRCKGLVGLGGDYDLVYARKGKVEDYNGLDAKGKIVILDRGELGFDEKWANAANAGAAFVLMLNNDDSIFTPNMGEYPNAPFFVIPARHREQLMNQIGKKITLYSWKGFM